MSSEQSVLTGLAPEVRDQVLDLADTAARLRALEEDRERLLRHRKVSARRLLEAGLSERMVARVAGVTGPAVHSWRESAS